MLEPLEGEPGFPRTLEVHYLLPNRRHSMDAFVQNKCEHELLFVLRDVAEYLGVQIEIETEPLGEGGIRRLFRVIAKQEGTKGTITVAIITALATAILVTPISKTSEKIIEKWLEDPEIKKLEKEKLKLEIDQLKRTLKEKPLETEKELLLRKRRSNFYQRLEQDRNIQGVSFLTIGSLGESVIPETTIPRGDFYKFVIADDTLPPIEVEHALIEIISPVLKKGNYKWVGFHSGEVIHFNMRSAEFKELVQAGQVEFKNGSTIDCVLHINRRIGSDGLVKIVGHEVLLVHGYFENDKPIETYEGRRRKGEKEMLERQYKLFD